MHKKKFGKHLKNKQIPYQSVRGPFVVVVSVLLPVCRHIGWGMPYLCILLKKLSRYKVQLLTNGCDHLSVIEIRT